MNHLRTALAAALLTALVGLPITVEAPADASSSAHPAARPAASRVARIVSRSVSFRVVNANNTSVLCSSDRHDYTLRAHLVGPRGAILGNHVKRVSVLVHDLATGSWVWGLPGHRAGSARVDYATAMARHGETSLVLDRLGYARSRLPDPTGTCLGAQADMLHQVVQELKSGFYSYTGSSRLQTPIPGHVVLQGYSTGAAIAEVEAATFDDVDGLVLMSWADGGLSAPATAAYRAQSNACRTADRASFGGTAAHYRALLFHSASAAVQRDAVRLRPAAPCGDPTSLTSTMVDARTSTRHIEAPVLLVYGADDVLLAAGAPADQAAMYAAGIPVTTHVLPGTGSALPLEHSAPQLRRDVLAWLR